MSQKNAAKRTLARRFFSSETGGLSFNYILLGLIIGLMAAGSAANLGSGLGASVSERAGTEAVPADIVASDAGGGGGTFSIELGAPSGVELVDHTLGAGLPRDLQEIAYDNSPGGISWGNVIKGVAILGVGIAIIATAPFSLSGLALVALAVGASVLVATAWELGECTFGDEACTEAFDPALGVYDSVAGFGILAYNYATDGEFRDALHTQIREDPWGTAAGIVQPFIDCVTEGDSRACTSGVTDLAMLRVPVTIGRSGGAAALRAAGRGGRFADGLENGFVRTAWQARGSAGDAAGGATGIAGLAENGVHANDVAVGSGFDPSAGTLDAPGTIADPSLAVGAGSFPTSGSDSYISFVHGPTGQRLAAHVVETRDGITIVEFPDGSRYTLGDAELASARVSQTSRGLFTLTPDNPLGIDESYSGIGQYDYLTQHPEHPLSQEFINPGGGCSVATGTNCQRVALIADQTLNGYAPQRAGQRVVNPDGSPNNLDGLHDAEIFHRANGSQVVDIVLDPNSGRSLASQVDEVVTGWGDGAKGVVLYDWASGGRHINNVVNVDGTVRFVDFQIPDALDGYVRNTQFPNATRVRVVRTQNVPWIDRNTFDGLVRANAATPSQQINLADAAAFQRANARLDELVGTQNLAQRSSLIDRLANSSVDEGTDLIRRVRENEVTLSAQDFHAQHIHNLAVPPPPGVHLGPGEVVLRSNRGLFAQRASAAGGQVVHVIDGQHAIVRIPPARAPLTATDQAITDLIANSGLSSRAADGQIEIFGSGPHLQEIAAQLPDSVNVSVQGDRLVVQPMSRTDYQPFDWSPHVDQQQVFARRIQRQNLGLGNTISF